MSGHADVLIAAALALAVLYVLVWIVSLIRRDASIADVVWGPAFVAVTMVASLIGDGDGDRGLLLVVLVTAWGLRLAGHIWWRSRSAAEDPRYRAMRRRSGERFPATSLVTVFGLQGLLVWVVSLPVQLAMTPDHPRGVGWLGLIGAALWGVGFFFETVGDAQLAHFRARPENSHLVMDGGLWRYTRHPNYFGDFCVWWGTFVVAAETTDARYGVLGPVVMSVLLLRVSGVPLLERSMARRRPGYTEYSGRTSCFLPRRPKSPSPG